MPTTKTQRLLGDLASWGVLRFDLTLDDWQLLCRELCVHFDEQLWHIIRTDIDAPGIVLEYLHRRGTEESVTRWLKSTGLGVSFQTLHRWIHGLFGLSAKQIPRQEKKNGLLHFATDHDPYLEAVAQQPGATTREIARTVQRITPAVLKALHRRRKRGLVRVEKHRWYMA